MNISAVLLLIVVIYSIILGLVVVLRNRRNEVNLVFSILCFVLAFCTFISFRIAMTQSEEQVDALLHLMSIRLLIFPLSVHFYLVLTQQKKLLRNYWIYFLLYAFPAVMIITTNPEQLFNLYYLGADFGWNFSLRETPLAVANGIFVFLLVLLLMFQGIHHAIVTHERIQRKQAYFILMGFVVSLFVPVILDIAIPFIPETIPQTSAFTSIIGYSLIAYAIIRYELFSANPENAAESVMETVNDAVLLVNLKGALTYINRATERILGYEAKNLLQKDINVFFKAPLMGDSGLLVMDASDNYIVHRAGHEVAVRISYAPIFSPSKKHTGYAFILHEINDLTTLIRVNEENVKKFRMVTENSSDIVTRHAESGEFVYVSPAINAWGYKADSLTGLLPSFMIHPDDVEMVTREILSSRENREGLLLEYRLRQANGVFKWVESNGRWVTEENRLFLVCNTRDISTRKIFEAQLQESERKYSQLVEMSPDDIFLINREMEFVLVNDHAAKSLGGSPHEFIGRKMIDVFPPEIAQRQSENVKKVFESGVPSEYLKTFTKTALGVRWYTTILTPVKDEAGNVISVMGIGRDITDIEEVELKIRGNEEKYRLFLESFQGIALRMNVDNEVEFLYGDVLNITGYHPEYFYNGFLSILRIVYHEDVKQIMKSFRMLRDIPRSKTTMDCRLVHKNGSLRHVKIFMQNISDESDKPTMIQAALFDKTDIIFLQNKVISSIIETEESERQRFAEDLHDELGPLLSSIRMYVNLVQVKGTVKDEETLQLIDFTKKLLDDAVQQAKNIAYNIMPEVLHDYGLIPSIKAFCSSINKTGELRIEINTSEIPEDVRFDQHVELALYRVLKELIFNTIKHARAANIFISLAMANEKPSVNYSDDGIGFDVIEQLNKASTLGIRNIYHRVQSVNGDVQFYSAPGKGTRVVITW